MKGTIIILALIILSSFSVISKKWNCNTMPEQFDSQEQIQYVLNNTDFEYSDKFETLSVRGIKRSSFYSCDKKTGYLVVEFHNRYMVYKNVDMKTWEEFRFSNSMESYFENKIKYKYIPV